jgi:hypothetical protein
MINIDELTLGQLKELRLTLGQSPQTSAPHPYEVGKNYFLRTVTHHLTGRLVEVGPQELVLEDAAWIADDGRFSDAMATGAFDEVEPYPEGRLIVGRASLIDAKTIPFALPRSKK